MKVWEILCTVSVIQPSESLKQLYVLSTLIHCYCNYTALAMNHFFHVYFIIPEQTAITLTFESHDFVNSITLSTNHRWHSNGSHLNSSLKAMPWYNIKKVFCTVHFLHCTTYYTYNTGINSCNFTIINKLGTYDAPPWGEQICWMYMFNKFYLNRNKCHQYNYTFTFHFTMQVHPDKLSLPHLLHLWHKCKFLFTDNSRQHDQTKFWSSFTRL